MAIVMMNGREYGGTGIAASSIAYYDAMNIGANNVQDAITQLCAESRKDIASCKSDITNLTTRVGTLETTLANAYNTANNAYTKANNAYNHANNAYNTANNAYTKANNAYTLASNLSTNITSLESKLPYNIVKKTQTQYNNLTPDSNTIYLIPI